MSEISTYNQSTVDLISDDDPVISTLFLNETSGQVVPTRDERLAVIEVSTLSAILLLAVTSNLTMLIALIRQRTNRPLSRMYFFMMHLSLADLLVSIFNILPQLAWDITFRFYGGDVLCRFVKYAQVRNMIHFRIGGFYLNVSSFILGKSRDRISISRLRIENLM